jgi:DNA-binding transcriptional MerR regulator
MNMATCRAFPGRTRPAVGLIFVHTLTNTHDTCGSAVPNSTLSDYTVDMEPEPDALIDIDELARRAGRRLEELGVAQANGQVTARPDTRTLRWYTTVGLLDRPVERRGRRAFYGRRHVAQVVAVKRLQAGGVSLTDIATRLAELSTEELEAVAGAPAPPAARGAAGAGATPGPGPGAIGATAPPPGADPGPARATAAAAASGGAEPFWSATPRSRSVGAAGVLAGVALDPTTSVTFAAPRPLTDADVDGLRRAALPLLDELRRRGLVPVPVHADLPKDLLP